MDYLTKEYIDFLRERVNYFSSKPITELTADEIKEYQNLVLEVNNAFPQVKKFIYNLWEQIKESEEFKAILTYQERVLNR